MARTASSNLNVRPNYNRNRATTAAIKKPPLGVLATASARENINMERLYSEQNLNGEAEILKVAAKVQSDIE